MIEKNTKTSKESEPSDDFRETLLKSGLDISAFQTAEPANLKSSDETSSAAYSVDFTKTENKVSDKSLAESILESPETSKKILPKFGRWQSLTAIGGIAAIIVLQSIFQFSFIQDESRRLADDLSKNALPVKGNVEKIPPPVEISETKPTAKIETKIEYKKTESKNPVQPKKNAPKMQTEIKEKPVRTVFRKKEQRSLTAERLRRAEKILTGI